MAVKQKRICHECGRTNPKGGMYRYELYDTPWDKEPHIAYLCKIAPKSFQKHYYRESCDELLTDTSWADFRYFECDGCQRMVCEQNPCNGWHVQDRYLADGELHLCLKCYEEHILENGVERGDLEDGHLPGMFFSGDNHEPLDAGYEHIGEYFIGDEQVPIKTALDYIDRGYKVVVGYERMAIGGLEGTVSLFVKQ